MTYAPENKLAIKAVFAGLCATDRIRPLSIESDSHVTVEMDSEAERKLAEVICKCDAFDASAACESFFTYELDHSHIGNRTALGITTGFFNDDWALTVPHSLSQHMIKRAVSELDEILDKKEIFQLVQSSPRWRQLHDEYEREMERSDRAA
jgi:hypothetical protein